MAVAPQNLDVLQPIVDDKGRPNVYFLRYLQNLRLSADTGETQSLFTGYLTTPAFSVSADSSGTVSSFAEAGGEFLVFFDGVPIESGVTFSVEAETGVDVSIDPDTGVYTVDDMADDSGVATFRATYGGLILELNYSISKSVAGADGDSSFTVTLTNESDDILVDADGENGDYQYANGLCQVWSFSGEVTSSATFGTAIATGCVGTVNTATNTPVDGQPKGYYRVTSITANEAKLTIPVTIGSFTVNKVFTLSKNRTGANLRISANRSYLSYDAADAASPSSQTTTFNVIRSGTAATVTWEVHDINGGGTYSPVGSFLTIAGDFLSATMTVSQFDVIRNGTNGVRVRVSAVVNGVTIDDYMSISKVNQGEDAKSLTVYAFRNGIGYDENGVAEPSVQTNTFFAEKVNTIATVTWSVYDLDGTLKTPTSSYLSSTTGDTTTMTVAQFESAAGTTGGVSVLGSLTDGTTLTFSTSVHKVESGAAAIGFAQTTSPGPGTFVNQLWIDTDDKLFYRWNGSSWIQTNGDLSGFDIVTSGLLDFDAVTTGVESLSAGGGTLVINSTDGWYTLIDAVVTVTDELRIEWESSWNFNKTDPQQGDEFDIEWKIIREPTGGGTQTDLTAVFPESYVYWGPDISTGLQYDMTKRSTSRALNVTVAAGTYRFWVLVRCVTTSVAFEFPGIATNRRLKVQNLTRLV